MDSNKSVGESLRRDKILVESQNNPKMFANCKGTYILTVEKPIKSHRHQVVRMNVN